MFILCVLVFNLALFKIDSKFWNIFYFFFLKTFSFILSMHCSHSVSFFLYLFHSNCFDIVFKGTFKILYVLHLIFERVYYLAVKQSEREKSNEILQKQEMFEK